MLNQDHVDNLEWSARIPFDADDALARLSESLRRAFRDAFGRPLVIVCVGSDRATGDSFGPLIGTKLRLHWKAINITVYGDLNEPVHAQNLESILADIETRFRNPFILAVDACLGRFNHIGHITLEKGPLRAGAGVGKQLTAFGDYCLMGVVNVSGFLEQVVLQSTRLGLVMQMADLVAEALEASLKELQFRHMTAYT